VEYVAHRTRILLFEDDADHAAIIKLYLEQHGNKVKIIHDPDLLHAALRRTPDILVVDVMPPGTDRLRQGRGECALPGMCRRR
jgi:DNA-binding response OmpR family regulator